MKYKFWYHRCRARTETPAGTVCGEAVPPAKARERSLPRRKYAPQVRYYWAPDKFCAVVKLVSRPLDATSLVSLVKNLRKHEMHSCVPRARNYRSR